MQFFLSFYAAVLIGLNRVLSVCLSIRLSCQLVHTTHSVNFYGVLVPQISHFYWGWVSCPVSLGDVLSRILLPNDISVHSAQCTRVTAGQMDN